MLVGVRGGLALQVSLFAALLLSYGVLPFDSALDLTFKVNWVCRGQETHLYILVRIWFELAKFGLKNDLISPIELEITYQVSPVCSNLNLSF